MYKSKQDMNLSQSAQVFKLTSDLEKCPDHPDMVAMFVCLQCNERLACPECVAMEHQCHKMAMLTKYIPQRKEQLKEEVKGAIHMRLPDMKKEIERTNSILQGLDSKHAEKSRETRNDIQKRLSAVKEKIEETAKKYSKLCEENERDIKQKLSEYRDSLQTSLYKYQSDIDKVQTVLENGSDSEFLSTSRTSLVPPPLPKFPDLSYRKLDTADFSEDLLEQVFGALGFENGISVEGISKAASGLQAMTNGFVPHHRKSRHQRQRKPRPMTTPPSDLSACSMRSGKGGHKGGGATKDIDNGT